MTFFPSVLLAAYLGGLGPGLLATFLSAAAADFFLLEPRSSFTITHAHEAFALGLLRGAGPARPAVELASELGVSPSAVYVNASRARARVRERCSRLSPTNRD